MPLSRKTVQTMESLPQSNGQKASPAIILRSAR